MSNTNLLNPAAQLIVLSLEEEEDRREGKGRRGCLGDEVHSTPWRTTDLAPG